MCKGSKALVHSRDGSRLHFELLVQSDRGSLDARVYFGAERFRKTPGARGKLRCVSAGQDPRAERIARRIAIDRGNWKFVFESIRRGVVQIPNEAMHPRFRRKYLFRASPIHRNGIFRGKFFHGNRFIGAGEPADEVILTIEDFQRDGVFRNARKVVVDDRAIGRIFPGGEFRRQRRVRVAVPAKTNCFLRSEKMRGGLCHLVIKLPQRREVIKNPERAAVRRNDQVIAVNVEVTHRGVWQIQLQRLPVVAVVERNVDGSFRSREEQTFSHGIFAYHVARAAIGNAPGNFRPRFSIIARAINVRAQIVETK